MLTSRRNMTIQVSSVGEVVTLRLGWATLPAWIAWVARRFGVEPRSGFELKLDPGRAFELGMALAGASAQIFHERGECGCGEAHARRREEGAVVH